VRLREENLTENQRQRVLEEKRSKSLQYLNVLEFLCLLINKKEITNGSIIEHFIPSIKDESIQIFKEYPDIAKDDTSYEQIKKLLKKWGVTI